MRKNMNGVNDDTFLKNWLMVVIGVFMIILLYLGYTYFMNTDNEPHNEPHKRPNKRPNKPHRTHRDYNNNNDKQPSGWKALKNKANVSSALKGIKKFNIKY